MDGHFIDLVTTENTCVWVQTDSVDALMTQRCLATPPTLHEQLHEQFEHKLFIGKAPPITVVNHHNHKLFAAILFDARKILCDFATSLTVRRDRIAFFNMGPHAGPMTGHPSCHLILCSGAIIFFECLVEAEKIKNM